MAIAAAIAIAQERPEPDAVASVLFVDPALVPHSSTSTRLDLVGEGSVGDAAQSWVLRREEGVAAVRASTPGAPQSGPAALDAAVAELAPFAPHVVVDCPPGPPVLRVEGSALVYVTRPDEDALRRLTDHMVWLGRQGFTKGRLSVVVSHHMNSRGWTSKSRQLATALSAHVSEVVHVPSDKGLGPGRVIRLDQLKKNTQVAVLSALLAATPGRSPR